MPDELEDRRAHQRIDNLETIVKDHLAAHTRFEEALAENTKITKSIQESTASTAKSVKEVVVLLHGLKSIRTFAVWASPIFAALAAIWAAAWAIVTYIFRNHS